MAESLDGIISELSELRSAVESLAARVEQMSGEGRGGGIPPPAAGAPDDVALTGPVSGNIVREVHYTSSSSGGGGALTVYFTGADGRSSSSAAMLFVPEEI